MISLRRHEIEPDKKDWVTIWAVADEQSGDMGKMTTENRCEWVGQEQNQIVEKYWEK